MLDKIVFSYSVGDKMETPNGKWTVEMAGTKPSDSEEADVDPLTVWDGRRQVKLLQRKSVDSFSLLLGEQGFPVSAVPTFWAK